MNKLWIIALVTFSSASSAIYALNSTANVSSGCGTLKFKAIKVFLNPILLVDLDDAPRSGK